MSEEQATSIVEIKVDNGHYFSDLGKKPLVPLETMLGIPESRNESLGIIADLVANNGFEKETEEKLDNLHLNGKLMGIGVASIFGMLDAFDNCEELISMDIHPIPVAIGRSLKDFLMNEDSFENFFANLSNRDLMQKNLIEQGLPEKYIEAALKGINDAVDQYALATSGKVSYAKQDGKHVVMDSSKRTLFPLSCIKAHYNELQTLAKTDKMHFLQQDFFWPGFWEKTAQEVPSIVSGENLIYASNSIDHEYRSKIEMWEKWREEGKKQFIKEEQWAIGIGTYLNFMNYKNSKFVFTLSTLDYKLKLQNTPPTYGFKDDELILEQ